MTGGCLSAAASRHRGRHAIWFLLLLSALAVADEPFPRGLFLVASPDHALPGLQQTVVLIRRHAAGDTIGVVVNRPLAANLADQFPGSRALGPFEQHLYDGGDDGAEQLVFLFQTSGLQPRNALHLFEHVYLSQDLGMLTGILRHPMPFGALRLFSGYQRWEPGALQAEIIRGGWWMLPADVETLFSTPPGQLWQLLVARYQALAGETASSADGVVPAPLNAL